MTGLADTMRRILNEGRRRDSSSSLADLLVSGLNGVKLEVRPDAERHVVLVCCNSSWTAIAVCLSVFRLAPRRNGTSSPSQLMAAQLRLKPRQSVALVALLVMMEHAQKLVLHPV